MAAPLEVTVEESSAAAPIAISAVVISVWPRFIRPPNGSVQTWVGGSRKLVIDWRTAFERWSSPNTRSSTAAPSAFSLASARVYGTPVGTLVPSVVCTTVFRLS